jgi:hypothetical protein
MITLDLITYIVSLFLALLAGAGLTVVLLAVLNTGRDE